jgi:hypothetical protein
MKAQDFFTVGEGATVHGYSDAHAYTVIKLTDKSVTLRRDKATLLNGVNSGHPEALSFAPGGFCGHTSGRQIWKYEEDLSGHVVVARMTNRTTTIGSSLAGTEKVIPIFKSLGRRVTPDRGEHYDFNF